MTADETAAVFTFTGGWGHASGLVDLRVAPVPADGSVGLSPVLAAKAVGCQTIVAVDISPSQQRTEELGPQTGNWRNRAVTRESKVVEQFEQYRAQVPAPRLGVKGPYTDTE